jgi:aminoglycoside phosphotransferase (APT) family kinase protein
VNAPAATDAIERRLREAGVIPGGAPASFRVLTGGVASDIWCIEAGPARFAVKRALAKLRVAADWRVPVERNATEAEWLATASRICPGAVPRVIFHDPAAGFFAMEYLAPDRHPVWKNELRDGRADPAFAARVGTRLAQIHSATAGDPVVAARFANDANFHAIRLEPYIETTAAKHPAIADRLMRLSRETLGRHVALVHGDVSPKNILVGPDGPIFLDAECAWYGDPAFDVAFCLNHLLLKCVWTPPAATAFVAAFDALRTAYLATAAGRLGSDIEARVAHLLPALLLARIDGKSPVEYIDKDADRQRVRAVAVPLIAAPPAALDSVRDAWRAEFA